MIIFHSVFLSTNWQRVSLCDAYWKCTRTLPTNAISPILTFFLKWNLSRREKNRNRFFLKPKILLVMFEINLKRWLTTQAKNKKTIYTNTVVVACKQKHEKKILQFHFVNRFWAFTSVLFLSLLCLAFFVIFSKKSEHEGKREEEKTKTTDVLYKTYQNVHTHAYEHERSALNAFSGMNKKES